MLVKSLLLGSGKKLLQRALFAVILEPWGWTLLSRRFRTPESRILPQQPLLKSLLAIRPSALVYMIAA